MAGVYIADIRVSPAVRDHIGTKHNVSEQDVQQAFILATLVSARWSYDPMTDRLRLVAVGTCANPEGRLKAYLYPVDPRDGVWRLGTAMWSTR